MFDLRQFAALAPEWYVRLRYYEELGSTNDEACRLAELGAEHGTVVLAEYQLQGRGRRGSVWFSERGDGLLFSLVLRPSSPVSCWSRIALSTGLAIAEVLRTEFGVPAEVKWPNDIYIHGRKCAGILVETRGDFVIVGVGLNVDAAPKEEASVAVNDLLASPVSREKILARVLDMILKESAACENEFPAQLARLREICYLSGKKIVFSAEEKNQSGEVLGIGIDGGLIVENETGVTTYVQAAEIRVVD